MLLTQKRVLTDFQRFFTGSPTVQITFLDINFGLQWMDFTRPVIYYLFYY